MARISAIDFDRWEDHRAYYKIWVRDCDSGERYYNCLYYEGSPKNSCGYKPSGSEFSTTCYVPGRKIGCGGHFYKVKLWKGRCEEGDYEDSESLYIPSDPDACDVQCQTSCQVSCQGSCESVCQSYCQQNCQSTCQLSCQTACEITSEFCGRDCGRSVGR